MEFEAKAGCSQADPHSPIPEYLRCEDEFHHIDAGFVNERLCMTAIPAAAREWVVEHCRPVTTPLVETYNRHVLVTAVLDWCEARKSPTLLEAINDGAVGALFRSTERLAACPELYEAKRVKHDVILDIKPPKPIRIAYHTQHLVSDTGKMVLEQGYSEGYVNSIIGRLHDRGRDLEIEPLVIGAPWFEHPRNHDPRGLLMFLGQEFGEIQPEDIEEFEKLVDVPQPSLLEWECVMREQSEEYVKRAICELLGETTKKDWGGEQNDHFSGNLTVRGRRRTGAFLLKGPSDFREMTLDMCGKRADQIHRLVDTHADISILQHAHLVGPVVRRTLRNLAMYPGGSRRKYCIVDGPATYRLLRAYGFLK